MWSVACGLWACGLWLEAGTVQIAKFTNNAFDAALYASSVAAVAAGVGCRVVSHAACCREERRYLIYYAEKDTVAR